jgi:hypothetical protein
MATLYVYSLENDEHVATIKGEDFKACEAKANDVYDSNDYAWTYSPSFGMVEGLEKNDDAEVIEA